MRTYQDLMACAESQKGEFCREAVDSFRSSVEYRNALAGERYYAKHNQTIEEFQKFLYTMSGRRVPDLVSANYKLKTLFFRRLVSQQVQYVLGNGIKTINDEENKKRLGKNFDFQLQAAAKRAMAAGRSFGFWNYDHMEVFGYADTPAQPGFCPLYSDQTGELMAGVRFWFRRIGDDMIFRSTLYEPDGYTEFRQINEDDVETIQEKKAYKTTIVKTQADGITDVIGENYSTLPIVPMYANDSRESELVGIRECIDCYDYIKSGLANDIDDTSGFYWIIKNSGGMDDVDMARFIQRLKTVKAAEVGEDDEVQAHTLDIPVEARSRMLEVLRKDIYEDFQALDVQSLSAAAKTTQEIQAAYQSQDNKCADFEYFILDFCDKIMELAGIDDEIALTWNRVVNQQEQTNMILSAANFISEECVIQHLPFLTPEEAIEEIRKRENEQISQFSQPAQNSQDETEEDETEEDEFEEDEFAEDETEEDDGESQLLADYSNDVIKMLEDLLAEVE